MQIEFDPAKNAANVKDRGLPFEMVAEFDFSTAAIFQDARKVYPEVRFMATSFLGKRLHVLCFTPRGWWHSCYQLSQGQRQRGKRL